MKKILIPLILAALVGSSSFAADLTFRISPVGYKSTSPEFSYGFGGFAQADVDLFGFMTLGLEGMGGFNEFTSGDFDYSPSFGWGVGMGFYYFPLSRLYMGLGASAGLYQINTVYVPAGESEPVVQPCSDFYYRAYGELGFRINSSVTVGATGGYLVYATHDSTPMIQGPFGGVNLRITATLGKKGSSDFGISFEQYSNAFPLYMSAYKNCPLGMLTLRNNTGAEVRDVHVSLRAGKYTSQGFESASIPVIRKYGTSDILLVADFSQEILKFSEDGKISAEVVVDYELLGKRKQSVQNISLSVYNRNAFVWSDPTGLCAFVNAETPEVLSLAKNLAGIAGSNYISGMNKSVQIAAAMVEGLLLSGITYSGDKETPYFDYHNSYEVDSIQYPLQTMEYLGGDYDDLGILLMSCLESVGIDTAFIPLDDDFIVMVNAAINPGQELNYFGSDQGLIIDDESVYFPLSMVQFEKGFAASRKEGLEKIKKIFAGEYSNVEFIKVPQGWQVYSPCVYTGTGSSFANPSQSSLAAKLNSAINDYINTDLAQVISRARQTGDANKLGVALYRAGRYTEAKREFQKLKTTKAMNNLANVYMVEKNYAEAARLYRNVLASDPGNSIAKKGLDSANLKLGN